MSESKCDKHLLYFLKRIVCEKEAKNNKQCQKLFLDLGKI